MKPLHSWDCFSWIIVQKALFLQGSLYSDRVSLIDDIMVEWLPEPRERPGNLSLGRGRAWRGELGGVVALRLR